MFYCKNTSQVSNVTSSPFSFNIFFFFFWLKIKHSFLTLLHLIHLGMQNNRCDPGQTIKDIGSEVCVSVCGVCVGKLPRQMV